ncbi:MAG: retropepsin-like aspartic protease [Caulobacteraceae bacterium]
MKRSAAAVALALCLSLPTRPVLAACTLGKMAELPVTMTGLRPMVPAKINGVDALFIADSGAFYSMISPASAAEHALKLAAGPYRLTTKAVGGDVTVSLTTVKIFTLADAAIPNVQFLVGGGEPGSGAVGLIGQNVLGLADVEYDLADGTIRLIRPHDCGRHALAYWASTKPYSVMDFGDARTGSRMTVGEAFVDGVKIRALFDTGASTSVLSLRAAARAGIRPGGAGVVDAGVTGGLGRRAMATWIAPFASFKIGEEEIRNTRLRIGALDLGDGTDMLIGADFFLSHRVYVANSQHKIYFTYNGGPVFNLTAAARVQAGGDAAPKAAAPLDEGRAEPTDAESFSRRGAAFAARRDFASAIADFTRAGDLAPTEAKYFRERAWRGGPTTNRPWPWPTSTRRWRSCRTMSPRAWPEPNCGSPTTTRLRRSPTWTPRRAMPPRKRTSGSASPISTPISTASRR